MEAKQVNFGNLSSARRWALLALLLLVTVTAGIQVLHWHRSDVSTESRHCTICQIAQSPMQAAAVAPLAFVFIITALLHLSAEPDPKRGLESFSLFCRPPPLA